MQDKLDHLDAWDLDSRLELAMDALRCPPGDTPVSMLSGGERRRVALCRLLLTAARYPAAGRADQPPGCRVSGWLEKHLQDYRGDGHRRHP